MGHPVVTSVSRFTIATAVAIFTTFSAVTKVTAIGWQYPREMLDTIKPFHQVHRISMSDTVKPFGQVHKFSKCQIQQLKKPYFIKTFFEVLRMTISLGFMISVSLVFNISVSMVFKIYA